MTDNRFTIIVAVDSNYGIGKRGTIPWKNDIACSKVSFFDMVHFRNTTMGGAVVMGRITYESIGKPLKGRLNIVLSRSSSGVTVEGINTREPLITVNSIEKAIEWCDNLKHRFHNRFVIGGGQIYEEVIEKKLWKDGIITTITNDDGSDATYDCDVFFDKEIIKKYSTGKYSKVKIATPTCDIMVTHIKNQ